MAKEFEESYFVVAAVVAAELHKAMALAREISLTASNARALALRAGRGAAGFRAITDFIDDLATLTINASESINKKAMAISRMASDTARAQSALERFSIAQLKANDARYLNSINTPISRTEDLYRDINHRFKKEVRLLTIQLEDLNRELRTATVLAAMSRVEASQSGNQFTGPLYVVAENVACTASKIQEHVKRSHNLFNRIK